MTGLREQFRTTLTSHWRTCVDNGGPTPALLDELMARVAAETNALQAELATAREYASREHELVEASLSAPETPAEPGEATPPTSRGTPAPRSRTRAGAGGGKAKPATGRRTAQGGAK